MRQSLEKLTTFTPARAEEFEARLGQADTRRMRGAIATETDDTSTLDDETRSVFEMLLRDLRDHALAAMQLELSTLPPYLTTLYSIQKNSNSQSAQVILSVAMEEMYHLTLAGNIATAIGAQPQLNTKEFIPKYPGPLPDINDEFIVHLQKFSPEAIQTFMRIEAPKPPPVWKEIPPGEYQTIGEFYHAYQQLLDFMCRIFPEQWVFSGDPSHQVPGDYYYGGGGEVRPVTCLSEADWAINTIVEQGEGADHGTTVRDGDLQEFDQQWEPAHYYRFQEIDLGRHYAEGDKPDNPTGEPLEVDYSAVHNLLPDPTLDKYPEGSPIRSQVEQFNITYMQLLTELTTAFNGDPSRLIKAVGGMYELKYQAQALMRTPVPGTPFTACPTWQYAEIR